MSAETSAASSMPATGATAPSSAEAPPGLWTRVTTSLTRIDKDLAVLKLGVLSVLGTVIGLYFQSLSAYQDKVSAQAKEDLTAATDTFKDSSGVLSTAITLQALLFRDFVEAAALKASDDKNALTSKHAQDLYKSYEDAATRLREGVNVMARKVQMNLDWASDIDRDPANITKFGTDRISTSYLGAVDFDCDSDKPKLDANDHTIVKTKGKTSLTIDWYSAKHHVLTIGYCFDVTHRGWMQTVRQWASQSSQDQSKLEEFSSGKKSGQLQDRLDTEVVRLNDFMSLAMHQIERIRVKYRPTGFYCNLPGVSRTAGLFQSHNPCTPIRLRD